MRVIFENLLIFKIPSEVILINLNISKIPTFIMINFSQCG